MSGPFVNFVVEGQNGAGVRSNFLVVTLFALSRSQAEGISGVQIPQHQLLFPDKGRLANTIIVVAIRGTHECGSGACDPPESQFDTPHLIMYLIPG